jgi:transcription antitermination factor NusG
VEEEQKYFILWTTTLRSYSLIQYIVNLHNAQLWCPQFKCVNLEGKEEEVQIYPSYYFILCTKTKMYEMQEYIKDRKYKGMFFLKSGEHIAYLNQHEIEQIKYVEDNYTMDKYLGINPNIKIGTMVKISNGPFVGIKGEVAQIKNTEYLLDLQEKGIKLWCSMDNIEIVS